MIKIAVASVVVFAFAVAAAHAASRKIRVIDGDTIKASNLRAPVRLVGVDAPQITKGLSGYKCPAELALGLQAKDALISLLGAPHKVVVKRTKDFDKYGRRLAIVTSDGKDVGQILVERGLAKSWDGRGPRPDFCS